MTLIVIGVSHRSAPFDVLDNVALTEDAARELLVAAVASDHVAEAMVLATCNRVEVYADVDRFHGAVEDVSAALGKVSGVPVGDLIGHLYVHYDERAIHHLFSVAAGLDSMIVGEQQILGQVRSAVREAQEVGTAGKFVNDLGQTALRVAKRVHSETTIDRHGASVVSVALDRARELLGGLRGRKVAVVGAGAMGMLSVSYLTAVEPADLIVLNRTRSNAERLVANLAPEVAAHVRDFADLPAVLAEADVVVACTGATGVVISGAHLTMADRRTRPLVLVDLALPHDVDPAVRDIPGVTLVDLAALAALPGHHSVAELAATAVVDAEVAAFQARQAALSVEPIVVSLRARADGILDREVSKLRLRVPQLDDAAADEVERAMRRAMSTLLHTPTVRMKQLAGDPDGERFTAAVRALFDLDPAAVHVISEAPDSADE